MPLEQQRAKHLITILWTVSFVCFASAFNRREAAMATVIDGSTTHQSYATAGPCGISSRRNIRLDGNTSAANSPADESQRGFTIHTSVTFPTGGVGANSSRVAPYPVMLFLNGFQMRASWYRQYANRLASWGFVCVQYDDPLLKIIDDATELQYFDTVIAWLREQNAAPGGFLNGSLDISKLAVAGHSRGGKLAGLLFAARPEISTAFLVDPVDNTDQTPEGSRYPSAIRALAAAGRPFGMLGAGHTGRCNPEGANYKAFFEVAAAGSWQAVVERSGHTQFLSAGRLLDPVLRLLCPGGSGSPNEVMRLAMPPLVAWLDQKLRLTPSQAGLQLDFRQWVQREVAAGNIAFTAKGEASPEQPQGGELPEQSVAAEQPAVAVARAFA